jgi:hypothetical protein
MVRNIFCITLILIGFISISAQKKAIARAEFDSIYNSAVAKFKNVSYRVTSRQKSSSDALAGVDFSSDSPFRSAVPFPSEPYAIDGYSRPVALNEISGGDRSDAYSSKMITEIVSPSAYRYIFETSPPKTTSAPVKLRIEIISIDGKSYKRIGDGKWQEQKSNVAPRVASQSATTVQQAEYKFLGTRTLNGQNANVYEKTEKKKNLNSSNKTKTSVEITTKYWFSERGELLKVEADTYVQSGVSVSRQKFITDYERDPNIKIEKPN